MTDMGRLGCMAGKWSPGVSVREIPLFSFGVGIMCERSRVEDIRGVMRY